jgi:hypothetical protein
MFLYWKLVKFVCVVYVTLVIWNVPYPPTNPLISAPYLLIYEAIILALLLHIFKFYAIPLLARLLHMHISYHYSRPLLAWFLRLVYLENSELSSWNHIAILYIFRYPFYLFDFTYPSFISLDCPSIYLISHHTLIVS